LIRQQKEKHVDDFSNAIIAAIGVSAFFCLLAGVFVSLAIVVVSLWRIFNKAGRTGIYAFIPLVSPYQWSKIAGQGTIFAVVYALIVTFGTSTAASDQTSEPTYASLVGLVTFVMYVIIQFGIARRFGKGGLFAVGLIFLPFVFYPILAFGSASYSAN
jgi:hypothetical protein